MIDHTDLANKPDDLEKRIQEVQRLYQQHSFRPYTEGRKGTYIAKYRPLLNFLLKRHAWNKAKTSQAIGVQRSTLNRWLYGQSLPNNRSTECIIQAVESYGIEVSVYTTDIYRNEEKHLLTFHYLAKENQ